MAYTNEVKLVGNVGNDPEQRATKTGKIVTDFRIAVDTFILIKGRCHPESFV